MHLISRFDSWLQTYITALPAGLSPVLATVGFFGHPITLVLIALAAIIAAHDKSQPWLAKAFGMSVIAIGLSVALKEFLARGRPETAYVEAMKFKSYSFPSSHAFGSLLIYGLLAYLAYKHLDEPWNFLAIAAAALAVFIIGLSRVYLGAHYPSDVLGGWLLAAIVLIIIIKLLASKA